MEDDKASSKRSSISALFRKFRLASSPDTRASSPGSSKRYDHSDNVHSSSSKDERDNEESKPPSYDASQPSPQLEVPSLEKKEGNTTADLRWDIQPGKYTHKCKVYASLNSGYPVQKDKVKACHNDGCSFCAIIMRSIASGDWDITDPFYLRLDSPSNSIRINDGICNVEIYRSAESR